MKASAELYAWMILVVVIAIIVFSYWRLSKKVSSTRVRRFANTRVDIGSDFTFDPKTKSFTIHKPGTYQVTIGKDPKENK